MNTTDPSFEDAAIRGLLRTVLGASDTEADAAFAAATRLPEDDTRDGLTHVHVVVTLRHYDATYTLWRELLAAVGVESQSPGEAVAAMLLGLPPTDGDAVDWCGALAAVRHSLDEAVELLSAPAVRQALSAPADTGSAVAAVVTLARLAATPSPELFASDILAHVRDDHPELFTRLVETLSGATGAARVAQWRAATRELVTSRDTLLRHHNRRAEGGYPATDTEVDLLSGLLDTRVSRAGDGFVTIDAGADQWRDERGRVIHPLRLDQTGD